VDWRPAPPPPDLDLDGLVGDADLCPHEPEDSDGVADADGCADLDDDGDGIADLLDGCRFDREDMDRVQDTDGCPEPEVPVRLRVVNRAGDLVPLASASVDGDVHELGADVYLELVPGTYHLSAMGDGYASVAQDLVVDAAPVAVDLVLPPERIDLGKEELAFGTNSATLLPAARAALDRVARILDEHPEIEVLRIEGHTDARGDAMLNLRLSERRAAAVRAYLIEQGIEHERLVDQGYGEARPLDPSNTPEAHARNRRVELVVDRWGE
jgi:outer membrane protein OmpA-like peptidoglycan-associated protein